MSVSDYLFAAYSIIAGPFVLWIVVDTIVEAWQSRKATREHAAWMASYAQMVHDYYEEPRRT